MNDEPLREELVGLADQFGRDRSALFAILQEVHRRHAQISVSAMQAIAELLAIDASEVSDVVSFYSFLSQTRPAEFTIRVCCTESCELAGKSEIVKQLESDLEIKVGGTTSDGRFSLQWVNCLGLCKQAPSIQVNSQLYCRVTPEKAHRIIVNCRKARSGRRLPPDENAGQ